MCNVKSPPIFLPGYDHTPHSGCSIMPFICPILSPSAHYRRAEPFPNKRKTLQTRMCELSSQGRRHVEFRDRICPIWTLELGVRHRFCGLHHPQLQKDNPILPEKVSSTNRNFSIICSKSVDKSEPTSHAFTHSPPTRT